MFGELYGYLQSHFIGRIVFFGLCILLLVLTLLFLFQNKMLYIPGKTMEENPRSYRCPSERNLPFEDVNIVAEDGTKLHGWLVTQTNSKQSPTVVFFHENAGNIGLRLEFIQMMYQKIHCNFLLVAYRGYSLSEGEPSEIGIKLDSLAIMDYIMSRNDVIDTKNVFVMGRSLGGAVAVHALASADYKVRGLILENTFTSIDDMVDKMFPYVSFFKQFILKNHWRTIDLIGKLGMPMMFIIAAKDELVPPQHSERLFQSATLSEKKIKYIIEDAGHNASYTIDPSNYFLNLAAFINGVAIKRKNDSARYILETQ